MLSEQDKAEASAMLHEMLSNRKPVQRRTYAEIEEEQRRRGDDPYGCGGSLGQWIEADLKAKALAARKKVVPLINPSGPKNGPRVPFEVLLGTIQHGAWRSPSELAKAYQRPHSWVVRLRSVVLSQGYMTRQGWRECFVGLQRVGLRVG